MTDAGANTAHVKHGFVLSFDEPKPELDLDELESKVLDAIAKDLRQFHMLTKGTL